MKQLLINLKSLIKRGLLRIFPKHGPLAPSFAHVTPREQLLDSGTLAFCVILSVLSVVSCSTPRYATQLVHDIQRDTLYVSNYQFDSVYVFKDKITDRSRDTLYIREVQTEYKYRILRDTVLKVQHDSIPYEVTKIVTKEIQRPLTWFDHLTRWNFFFLIGALLTFIIIKIKRVF